jgi:protein TonB
MEVNMNIAQYKWPVVVAAGLHSALFISFPRSPIVVDRTPPPVVLPPVPPSIPVDLPDPADLPEDTGSVGGVNPLPTQPDLPHPAEEHPKFTVPITETTTTLDPVKDLRDRGISGPTGTSSILGEVGPPRMPSPVHLDRIPRTLAQPAPDYPYDLRNEGASGSVTVEFVVGTDGHVLTADAVRWTRREFVDPAVRAVLRWRFEPGMLDGRKVRFRMAVPIEFNAAR